MKQSDINTAIGECERFLAVANKAGTEKVDWYHPEDPAKPKGRWTTDKALGTTSRTSAAIKRASLDLTRALADMRKG